MTLFKKPKPVPRILLAGRKTVPELSLDSPAFVYVPAINTDLAATFARVRKQIGLTVTKTEKHV